MPAAPGRCWRRGERRGERRGDPRPLPLQQASSSLAREPGRQPSCEHTAMSSVNQAVPAGKWLHQGC